MSDIIVVFGSVTSKQYAPLRLAMLSRRLKPKIVRFDQSEQYKDGASSFFDKVYTPNESKYLAMGEIEGSHLLDADIDKAMNEHVQSALGKYDLADIKAHVFPHDCASADWLWFTSRLPDEIASYLVQIGEGDPPTYWLLGHGFGQSLPFASPSPAAVASMLKNSMQND